MIVVLAQVHNCGALQLHLEKGGTVVLPVQSLEAALAALLWHQPSLLVLFEFEGGPTAGDALSALRSHGKLGATPAIVVPSSVDPETVFECYHRGADLVLENASGVLEVIGRFL